MGSLLRARACPGPLSRNARGRALSTSVFASRRRHTRLGSDWSSDVCSSDLFCLRAEEHTCELQSLNNLVCRLLIEKKKAHVLIPLNKSRRLPESAQYQSLACACEIRSV